MIDKLLKKSKTDVFEKIAIIGDIHCENITLEKTIDFLKTKDVNSIFSTGDIVDGVGDVNLTIETLIKNRVYSVLGNHDRWLLENKMRDLINATQSTSIKKDNSNFLEKLPKEIQILTPNGLAIISHGIRENDMNKIGEYDSNYTLSCNLELQNLLKSKKFKYLIQGHSHNRLVKKIEHLTVFNAGSLVKEDVAGFIIIDFVKKLVNFYIFDKDLNIIESTILF